VERWPFVQPLMVRRAQARELMFASEPGPARDRISPAAYTSGVRAAIPFDSKELAKICQLEHEYQFSTGIRLKAPEAKALWGVLRTGSNRHHRELPGTPNLEAPAGPGSEGNGRALSERDRREPAMAECASRPVASETIHCQVAVPEPTASKRDSSYTRGPESRLTHTLTYSLPGKRLGSERQ
jgi:hypothetical protein